MSMSGTAFGKPEIGKPEIRLLTALANSRISASRRMPRGADVAALAAADLVRKADDGGLAITSAGRAFLARRLPSVADGGIGPFRRQHSGIARARQPEGRGHIHINEAESPLLWLARRKGRDGLALIAPHQLQAGERLRADFTAGQLTPRVTSNWDAPLGPGRRTGMAGMNMSDFVITARQKVNAAMDAVGVEFAGLLLDVCCFLKRLEDVERERSWPPRSAKVVLQLALDRLATHYGYGAQAQGPHHARIRVWNDEMAE